MGGESLFARAAGALRRRQVEPWAEVVGGGAFPAAGGLIDAVVPAWRVEPVRLRVPDDERWKAHRRQSRALLVANGLDLAASYREALELLRELAVDELPEDLQPLTASGLLAVMARLEIDDLESRGREVTMRARAAGVAVEVAFQAPPADEVEERLRKALRFEDVVESFDALAVRWSGYAARPPIFHKETAAHELLKSLYAALLRGAGGWAGRRWECLHV